MGHSTWFVKYSFGVTTELCKTINYLLEEFDKHVRQSKNKKILYFDNYVVREGKLLGICVHSRYHWSH